MAIQPKEILKYIASLAFGGTILYFVYRDQDMGKLMEAFSKVNFFWVGLSVLIGFLSNYIRAIRWKQMLAPLGYYPTVPTILSATMGAYLANFVLPRMGEVVRCGMLNRTDKVPINVSIGSVIAERLVDLLGLMVVTLLTIALEFDRLKSFFTDFAQSLSERLFQPVILIGLLIAIAGCIVLFIWLKNKKDKKTEGKTNKIAEFIQGLIAGLIGLKDLKNIPLFIFYSAFIWFLYFMANYVLFKSIPSTINLTPLAGLAILVMGSVGMAAPVQGGIGAYHIMVTQGLLLYGISEGDAKIFAGLAHTTTALGLLVTGALTVMIVQLFFIRKTNGSER
jgi:glycosyltransferase 2 family protein